MLLPSLVLFALSVVSGMLGIGVAFAAVPVLSLFLPDLVNDVFPLSLALNGITALFSLAGFAHAGLVRWRRALLLALPTTLAAPLGALLARDTPEALLWLIYFLAVGWLLYETLLTRPVEGGRLRFPLALGLALPIAFVTGLIGVGPGFMLVPVLARCGIPFKQSAALNAFAVVPSSFAAAATLSGQSNLAPGLAATLLAASAVGALIGAILASRHLPTRALRIILGLTILAVSAYKAVQLLAA